MKILTVQKMRPILSIYLLSICVSGATASPQAPASDSSNPEQAAEHINGLVHPIKKALAPVESLEGQGIKMEQAIMKVSGPISELTPRMSDLDKTMNNVTSQVDQTKAHLTSTAADVVAARKDIAGMRGDIHALKEPVYALYKPIQETEKPLNAIQQQLNVIAWAILLCGAATAFGIPISCVLFWRYRGKLVPQLVGEPQANIASKTPVGVAQD